MDIAAYKRTLNTALVLKIPIISKWTAAIISYTANHWGKNLITCPKYLAENDYFGKMYGNNSDTAAYIHTLNKKDLYTLAKLICKERYNIDL